MKKLLILFVAVIMLSIPTGLMAGECETLVTNDVSTFTVTGDDAIILTSGFGGLQISSSTKGAEIHNITISNDEDAVRQVVTLYHNFRLNAGTSTVQELWQVALTSSTAVSVPLQEAFGDRYGIVAKWGLAIRKSSTGSRVRTSIKYR